MDFAVEAVDDQLVDGTVLVEISAVHSSYVGVAAVPISVRDNDGAWFRIQPTDGSTQVTKMELQIASASS